MLRSDVHFHDGSGDVIIRPSVPRKGLVALNHGDDGVHVVVHVLGTQAHVRAVGGDQHVHDVCAACAVVAKLPHLAPLQFGVGDQVCETLQKLLCQRPLWVAKLQIFQRHIVHLTQEEGLQFTEVVQRHCVVWRGVVPHKRGALADHHLDTERCDIRMTCDLQGHGTTIDPIRHDAV